MRGEGGEDGGSHEEQVVLVRGGYTRHARSSVRGIPGTYIYVVVRRDEGGRRFGSKKFGAGGPSLGLHRDWGGGGQGVSFSASVA
jgi:hypothetical protein